MSKKVIAFKGAIQQKGQGVKFSIPESSVIGRIQSVKDKPFLGSGSFGRVRRSHLTFEGTLSELMPIAKRFQSSGLATRWEEMDAGQQRYRLSVCDDVVSKKMEMDTVLIPDKSGEGYALFSKTINGKKRLLYLVPKDYQVEAASSTGLTLYLNEGRNGLALPPHPFIVTTLAALPIYQGSAHLEMRGSTVPVFVRKQLGLTPVLLNKGQIVTERVDGPDLQVALEQEAPLDRPLTVSRSTFWMLQLLSGLSFMHANQTVHRDIKKENILLDRNTDIVKLMDLGFSEHVDLRRPQLFCQAGTPHYMAFELAKNTQSIDYFKVDIFAFGATMYDIFIGGDLPWATGLDEAMDQGFDAIMRQIRINGLALGQASTFNAQSKKWVKALTQQGFSQDLAIHLISCLNPNPSQRPSASQLMENLLKISKVKQIWDQQVAPIIQQATQLSDQPLAMPKPPVKRALFEAQSIPVELRPPALVVSRSVPPLVTDDKVLTPAKSPRRPSIRVAMPLKNGPVMTALASSIQLQPIPELSDEVSFGAPIVQPSKKVVLKERVPDNFVPEEFADIRSEDCSTPRRPIRMEPGPDSPVTGAPELAHRITAERRDPFASVRRASEPQAVIVLDFSEDLEQVAVLDTLPLVPVNQFPKRLTYL